jgi:hypothetical protein
VGTPCTSKFAQSSGSCSELTVPKNKSVFISAILANIGAKLLQGPQELPQNTRKTILFSSTILSRLFLVTIVVLISDPHIFYKSWALSNMA